MLRAPALASPDSLDGQLEYIRHHWSDLLGDFLAPSAARAGRAQGRAGGDLDAVSSARARRAMPAAHHVEPAALVPSYAAQEPEGERFSPDEDWMARTVLVAKSTYVWLDQLSRRLRSRDHPARSDSRRGARDARAARLQRALADRAVGAQPGVAAHQAAVRQSRGGRLGVLAVRLHHRRTISVAPAAWENLRGRCRAHGIRLASDMVPNHMGIDSRWVIEHPERFLSLPESPFPAYRFDGPDLSDDGRVEIKIEDHYYDRSDAGRGVPAPGPLDGRHAASSITATTAPAIPGTTPPSSTSRGPTSARRSSRRSCRSRGSSRSSASTRR